MAKDQYKYFRIESRELLEGLSQATLELERRAGGKEAVARFLRLAHTLKGASRVVKQHGIADLAHALEDAMGPYRDAHDAIPKECTGQVLGLLDGIAAQVASLDAPNAETKKEIARPAMEEFFETVRVEIEETDRLLEGISEASVQLKALRRETETIERTRQLAAGLVESLTPQIRAETNGAAWTPASLRIRATAEELRSHIERLGRSLAAGIDEVESEFGQVRDATNRLRLLPASTIFPSLERGVRDAAQALRKEVVFDCFGGSSRLDGHVLATLRDALLHVVRNAVAHGIEPPRERSASGKPARGLVELRVERRRNRVAFVCRDDGRGIDVEAVRGAAVLRGLLTASDDASFGVEEAVRIVLQGGVTTMSAVDEVSGRGIGLDVVRETAARLKGEVTVHSEPGKGTSLEICVPVSLSSLEALEVDAGGTVAALPLDAVRRTMRVADHEIARSAEKDSILYEGKAIAFLSLPKALNKKTGANTKRRFWSTVILEAPSGLAAIGVDRLLGTTSIVVRPLPSLAETESIVSGTSLDEEGNPQLVLDPEGLVATASLGRAPVVDAPQRTRATVLVIDDSLTTRMLEQSILESAGYEVDLATSAEEGLGKAREKQYGLFLVDVEMPGMDGFEFVSRTQADPVLRTVPAILVTSRSAVEDRRRGEQSGARGYIVKGEFDQRHFLHAVREFIG